MKSKLSSTFNKLRIIMVAALTVFCVSCDKTETTQIQQGLFFTIWV